MGRTAMPKDPQVVNLNRLLLHLDRQLLSPASDQQALKSGYERARIRANFDYARSLLLTASSQRQIPQADLQTKRETLKRLQARLNELDQLHAADDVSDESDEEDEVGNSTTNSITPEEPSGIRQRGPAPLAEQATATTTSSNRYDGRNTPSSNSNTLQNREGRLDSDLREKDNITASLISLARELKLSATSFSASVEAEKGILGSTVEGLDKNVGGLEGAGAKMGQLRRETEGRGWWKRMILYAQIGALWVALLVLVFVLPKLRF